MSNDGCIIIRRSGCAVSRAREPPSPAWMVSMFALQCHECDTYHFERVKFLLDLLCKHGCKPITRGNVASAVVILWRPGVVKLYAGTEANVANTVVGCSGKTHGAAIVDARWLGKVVISAGLTSFYFGCCRRAGS